MFIAVVNPTALSALC